MLETHFSTYGEIKSVKIFLNSNHEPRDLGLVWFKDAESAARAIQTEGDAESN